VYNITAKAFVPVLTGCQRGSLPIVAFETGEPDNAPCVSDFPDMASAVAILQSARQNVDTGQ
jgi:hypothetical protein